MLAIELTGDDAPASVPGGAVYELAISLGVSSQRARKLRVMIDELVVLAQEREHGDRPAEVKVQAWTDKGHLRVEVRDRGIPVFGDDAVVPHQLVRLGFAEFIELGAHGSDGNLARCSVALSDHDDRAHLAASEERLAEDAPEVREHGAFEVRAMRPDECGDLARLFYRCYGYNYPSEDVYYPERIAPLLNEGLMHSVVVVNDEGVLVGHAALTKKSVEARIAEAGKLVVDPRYRSYGLAKEMATQRIQRATEQGLLGLWTECVSNHPYSQRNQLKLGAHEIGFFLGMMPRTVSMVGLDTEAGVRGSLVAMYLPLPDRPKRRLHAPAGYQDLIRRILTQLELERELIDHGRVPEHASRMTVSVNRGFNIAVIDVATVGRDLPQQLETQMEHLKDMRISVVFLDLPLSQSGTAYFGDHLAGFGFFFSALLPEYGESGDVLRLQFLNHEHVQPDHLELASEWGARLLALVVADQERVLAHQRALRRSD